MAVRPRRPVGNARSRISEEDREGASLDRLRRDALAVFHRALIAVDPARAVADAIGYKDGSLKIEGRLVTSSARVIHIIAVGKAALPMARGALQRVPIALGLVVASSLDGGPSHPRLRSQRASHPLPDEGSLRAGRSALELVDGLGPEDVLLVLISGGASAMMEATSVPLDDLRSCTAVLLRSGLGIRDVNEVRKGISEVKGGRLAERAAGRGARVITLVISDVVGDPIEDIGSGPTAPHSPRGARAETILRTAGLWKDMPASVRRRLEEASGAPKTWRDRSGLVAAFVIASNDRACQAARMEAERLGYTSRVWTTSLEGEARHLGPAVVSRALAWRPRSPSIAWIAGGETTVTVRGDGRGGRNQELALSAAAELEGLNAVLLACGTDGTDGNTDAAGAIVDGGTMTRARSLGLNPQDFLEGNNSYAFFRALNDLIITGPTGTNVADVILVLARRGSVRNGRKLNRSARKPGTLGSRRTPRPGRPVRRPRGPR